MHRHFRALGGLLVLAVGGVALIAGAPPRAQQVIDVEIQGFRFRADTVRVAIGATVRWTNRDQVGHTSTAENGDWRSALLGPGESFSRKFENQGTFPYYCTPHPFMRGVVIVESEHLGP